MSSFAFTSSILQSKNLDSSESLTKIKHAFQECQSLDQVNQILSQIQSQSVDDHDTYQSQLILILKVLLFLSSTYENELIRLASRISTELDTWKGVTGSYLRMASLSLSILPDLTYVLGLSLYQKSTAMLSSVQPDHWLIKSFPPSSTFPDTPYNATPTSLAKRNVRALEKLRIVYAEKLGKLVEIKRELIGLNVHDIQQLRTLVWNMLETIQKVMGESALETSVQVYDVPKLFESTRKLVPKLEHLLKSKPLHVTLQRHRYPYEFRAYWFHLTTGFFAAKYLLKQRTFNLIRHAVSESYAFTSSFLTEWFFKPLENMYNTIRHKDRQLALLSAESLQSDLQSLERMVIEFAKDQGETQVDHIADRVRMGDLTVVMEAYEGQIRSPLRSAFSGTLLRSLLIQIQKAKVDGEVAMSALDKLLKSNELNFALLATIPTMLVTYTASSWVYNKFVGRSTLFVNSQRGQYRASLRRFERVVDLLAQGRMSSTTAVGFLMFEIVYLRSLTPLSGGASGMNVSQRHDFLQDLDDLEYGVVSDPHLLKPLLARIWRTLF